MKKTLKTLLACSALVIITLYWMSTFATTAFAIPPESSVSVILEDTSAQPSDSLLRTLIFVGIGVTVVAAVVVIIFLLPKRKKKVPTTSIPETQPIPTQSSPINNAAASTQSHPDGRQNEEPKQMDRTVLLTQIENDQDANDKTVMMWENTPAVHKLVLQNTENPSQIYEFALRGTVTVGRDAAVCQIVFDMEPSVARRQCEVYGRNSRFYLRNLSTSNITCMDGRPILEECELKNGSILKMGRLNMRVKVI